MPEIVMKSAKMLSMLPEDEQNLAYEFIKRLVLAWDPDYTKLTPEEARKLEAAEASGFVDADEIDWDHFEAFCETL